MQFWIPEIIQFFRPRKALRIGFVLPEIGMYNSIMPSTRIRVLDIITAFRNHKHISMEVYLPLRKYDILIFQKKFDQSAYQIAHKHKAKSCKIILDINVNYYDSQSIKISQQQNELITKFTNICDGIICSSNYITNFIRNIYPKTIVKTIEEAIPQKYFNNKKKLLTPRKKLIWSGFSIKAETLLLIQDALLAVHAQQNIEIIIVSEQNPSITIGSIPIEYMPYHEYSIVETLLQGDIFIAPRSLNESYNLGHSFTKVGVAMALGIPCIASPIPSYTQSPALFCNTSTEWENALINLLTSNTLYQNTSDQGVAYCLQHYPILHIKQKYETFFKAL